MSGNDPWGAFRTGTSAPAAPVHNMPLPTSTVPIRKEAHTQHEEDNSDQRISLEQQRLDLDRQRQELQRQLDAAKVSSIAANSGVDTQAGQDQAASHAVDLSKAMETVLRAGPDAARPRTLETAVSAMTDNPTALAWSRHPTLMGYELGDANANRQTVAAALNNALESAVWLKTGAAADAPQRANIMSTIQPTQMDDANVLTWKKENLKTLIAEARVRAGPANVKANEALDGLAHNLDFIYSPKTVQQVKGDGRSQEQESFAANHDRQGNPMPNWTDKLGVDDTKLKGSTNGFDLMDYPPAAQAEHDQWMRMNPKAGFGEYNQFISQLSDKYLSGDPEYQKLQQTAGLGPASGMHNTPEQEATWIKYRDYYAAHPNADLPPIHWQRKLSPVESAINDFGQTDVGTAVGQTANALTAGIPEMLLSDRQRAMVQLRNSEHGKSAVLGDLVGTMAPGGALNVGTKMLEKLAAKKFIEHDAGMVSRLAGNTIYGGMRGGAAAPSGHTTEGVVEGAGASMIGGLAGETLGGGPRSFQSPETVQALDTLKKVKLTNLQRLGAGDTEEAIQGLGFARKARNASIESMNLDKANQALRPLGETLPAGTKAGFEANGVVNKILGNRYNLLAPKIQGKLDSAFEMATNGLRQVATKDGDPIKAQLWRELQGVKDTFKNGVYNGNIFRDAQQKLRQLQDDWSKVEPGAGIVSASSYHEMARVAGKLRGQLRAQVGRNNPEVAKELNLLDRGYAKSMLAEKATRSAQGVYGPKQLLKAVEQMDKSKGKAAFARGQAHDQDYALAAQHVIGSQGTREASSLWQTLMSGAAVAAHPSLAVPTMLAYAPILRQLTRGLASKRPENLVKVTTPAIAQMLRKYVTEGKDVRN